MKKDIDLQKLSVPLEWFVASIVFVVGCAVPSSYWVYSINQGMRELRTSMKLVKLKLNIPDATDDQARRESFIDEAKASK